MSDQTASTPKPPLAASAGYAAAVADAIGHLCGLIQSGKQLCSRNQQIHDEVLDMVRVLKELKPHNATGSATTGGQL